MKRRITEKLIEWKNTSTRPPLLSERCNTEFEKILKNIFCAVNYLSKLWNILRE